MNTKMNIATGLVPSRTGGQSRGFLLRGKSAAYAGTGRGANTSDAGAFDSGAGVSDARERRRFVNTGSSSKKNESVADRIIGFSSSYAESLQKLRTKKEKTALDLKKLNYNFKGISSKIMRSKTSAAARQAASSARREIQRLKRLRRSGDYDDEELEIAIEHAESMERVAKKKAVNLKKEEMIKVTDSEGDADHTDEIETDDAKEDSEEESVPEEYEFHEFTDEERAYYEELFRQKIEQTLAEQDNRVDEISQIAEETSAQTEEIMADMQDMLEETMEEMEMLEILTAPPPEMNKEEFKVYCQKHRGSEQKDIAEADREYLKAMFDKFERDRKASTAGINIGSAGGGSSGITGMSGGHISGGPSAAEVAGVAMTDIAGVSISVNLSV
ncbi:MAG: hypothetical protein K6G57_01285 [Lachnospiraceae bacterium]|nr:hypothetical protein [Lachnospiraceae bacterium]